MDQFPAIQLAAFVTSHVFLTVLGKRNSQRYRGLTISVVTDMRAFSRQQQGGLINTIFVCPWLRQGNTEKALNKNALAFKAIHWSLSE